MQSKPAARRKRKKSVGGLARERALKQRQVNALHAHSAQGQGQATRQSVTVNRKAWTQRGATLRAARRLLFCSTAWMRRAGAGRGHARMHGRPNIGFKVCVRPTPRQPSFAPGIGQSHHRTLPQRQSCMREAKPCGHFSTRSGQEFMSSTQRELRIASLIRSTHVKRVRWRPRVTPQSSRYHSFAQHTMECGCRTS